MSKFERLCLDFWTQNPEASIAEFCGLHGYSVQYAKNVRSGLIQAGLIKALNGGPRKRTDEYGWPLN